MSNNTLTKLDDTSLVSLDSIIPLVTNGVHSPNTKRVYTRALESFYEWFQASESTFDKATVDAYKQRLLSDGKAASTINQHLTCIRKLAEEAVLNGLLDRRIADGIMRSKAIPKRGQRTGTWLTETEAGELIRAPNQSTLKGKRDRVIIGLLMECGLRRDEAARLTVSQVQKRNNRWVICDLHGKGNRTRTVPIPPTLGDKIQTWIEAAGIRDGGPILRSINRGGRLNGTGMSAMAVYKIVKEYAESLNLKIAPHDLRRTFGKLTRGRNAKLEQIQVALGHASIRTTEIYLGLAVDLDFPACDTIDDLEEPQRKDLKQPKEQLK